jgi:uncharacterized cupin superfamily protein
MSAMEIHPGVFVSSTATEDWRSDPEPPPWEVTQTEVLLVLEGAARVEIEGGPTLDLQPGDMAVLPKGAVTRWHLTLRFKELWVLA